MTDRISTRDWDDLSAYLDGQLNTTEQTRVETRLRQDADFRSALEELRRTRAVVHSLPKLRAPRELPTHPGDGRPKNRNPPGRGLHIPFYDLHR